MSIQADLIRVAVRAISEKTDLLPNPDSLESFITVLFGGETHEDRLVRQIDQSTRNFTNGFKNGRRKRLAQKTQKV